MVEIRISNNIAITVQIFSDAFFDDVHFEHVTIALSFYSSKNHFGQFPNVLDHLIKFVQYVLYMVQKMKFMIEKLFLVRSKIILGLNSEYYYLTDTRLN